MADVPYQTDLKIALPGERFEKVTLELSSTGDIQLVDGKDKLVEQLLRSIINDETTLGNVVNSRAVSSNGLYTLFNLILRRFKQIQSNDVKRSDPNLSGFSVYRKAANTNEEYVKVSTDPINWKFIDTNLLNGIEYNYGITNLFSVAESAFIDKFSITPSRFSNRQTLIIGMQAVAFPGDGHATFYFDYNRKFKASELLKDLISINVQQSDVEPREYTVSVVVKNLLNNNVSVATKRTTIIT